MRLSSSDPNYSAQYVGTKLMCYYNEQLMATIKAKSILDAREILKDWARLKISIEDIVYFRGIVKKYVGCTIDDVRYAEDGKTVLINNKPIEKI